MAALGGGLGSASGRAAHGDGFRHRVPVGGPKVPAAEREPPVAVGFDQG